MSETSESVQWYLYEAAYSTFCQYKENSFHSSIASKFLQDTRKFLAAATVLAGYNHRLFTLSHLRERYERGLNAADESTLIKLMPQNSPDYDSEDILF